MRLTLTASVVLVFVSVAAICMALGWPWLVVLKYATISGAGWTLLLTVGGGLLHGVER